MNYVSVRYMTNEELVEEMVYATRMAHEIGGGNNIDRLARIKRELLRRMGKEGVGRNE